MLHAHVKLAAVPLGRQASCSWAVIQIRNAKKNEMPSPLVLSGNATESTQVFMDILCAC